MDLLFNLIGSFFYFWPLTSSKNYTTGGFKDFEFLSLDRYNSNIKFTYDYRLRRLRGSGKLGLVSFDVAFGAEGQSKLMIQAWMAMETSLEWASIPDISRAILFVLGIDIDIPVEKSACKSEYLRHCILHCLEIANNFEDK